MVPADDSTRLAGVYCLHPEEMLRHSIELALSVSCGLTATPAGTRAIHAIARNAGLSERAARLIMNHMLRGLALNEPTAADFQRLIQALTALAQEV